MHVLHMSLGKTCKYNWIVGGRRASTKVWCVEIRVSINWHLSPLYLLSVAMRWLSYDNSFVDGCSYYVRSYSRIWKRNWDTLVPSPNPPISKIWLSMLLFFAITSTFSSKIVRVNHYLKKPIAMTCFNFLPLTLFESRKGKIEIYRH